MTSTTINPLISVIIPIYAVEEYISKCILSIQAQSFKDFEAILVNDGSPDNSIEIAKILIKNDPRFIIIHKKNGGLASARNQGLDVAKGEYIMFVDSDDSVEPDFLLKPYQQIIKEKADICLFNMNYVDQSGNILKKGSNNLSAYISQNDFLISKGTIYNFVCDKLFKKDVFSEIRFDESVKTFEDVFVTFRLLYNRKLTSINDALYNYLQRPGSLSKNVHPTYLQDRVAIKNKQSEFVAKHNLATKHPTYITYTYLKTFVFYCSTHFTRYSKNYLRDINNLKSEIDPNIFIMKNIVPIIKSEPKTGLSLLLFKISPRLFRHLVKFWFRNAVA